MVDLKRFLHNTFHYCRNKQKVIDVMETELCDMCMVMEAEGARSGAGTFAQAA